MRWQGLIVRSRLRRSFERVQSVTIGATAALLVGCGSEAGETPTAESKDAAPIVADATPPSARADQSEPSAGAPAAPKAQAPAPPARSAAKSSSGAAGAPVTPRTPGAAGEAAAASTPTPEAPVTVPAAAPPARGAAAAPPPGAVADPRFVEFRRLVEQEVAAQLESAAFRDRMAKPADETELAKYRALVAAVEPHSARVSAFFLDKRWNDADRRSMEAIMVEVQETAQRRYLESRRR